MFILNPEQSLLDETTARFLDTHFPLSRTRELMHEPPQFDVELWRRGAELGWTSLLVPEAKGGGSISENGVVDLVSVALQFGRRAAPGPLLATNLVAAALGRWGSDAACAGPLKELLAGTSTAAWCPPTGIDPCIPDHPLLCTQSSAGDEVVINGVVPCVDSADTATYLLVGTTLHHERSHFLLPVSSPGVGLTPLSGLDITRRFSRVELIDVHVPVDARVGAGGAVECDWLIDLCATMLAAEIVGAMKEAFDLTLVWVNERYSFGRPLGSYQAIKHRVAEMCATLEACASVVAKAAGKVGAADPDASEWASAAMTFVAAAGPEVIQDCVQLHGGIGVTAEHNLHVLLRRAIVSAKVFGTSENFAQRLVAQIDRQS